MKTVPIVIALGALAAPVVNAQPSHTFVGVITDSMCRTDHRAMNVTPDSKCVQECVRDTKTFTYVLTDGKRAYLLSDQQTPAQFAGAKVKVTGVLYRRPTS
jgi:hypothetical protein